MKETPVTSFSGIPFLLALLAGLIGCAALFVTGIPAQSIPQIVAAVLLGLVLVVCLGGFYMIEPNQAAVLSLFGRYIGTVKAYNIKARQFPTNLTAKVFGYQPKANFTVQNEAQISQPPTVDFSSERK